MSYVYVLKEDVENAQADDLAEIYSEPSDDFELSD
jgi:hypothetical protein